MKSLFIAFITIVLFIGSTYKFDLVVPQYDTEVIYGKSAIVVLGWDRTYDQDFSWYKASQPTFLLKTSDSFYIKTNDYYEEDPLVFNSDSIYNYHLIHISSLDYYRDTVSHHARFSFKTEPSWFDINGFSEVFFYNDTPNKIFTPERTLLLDSTPCIYRLVIKDNQVKAISQWDYKPQNAKLLSVKPYRYSRTYDQNGDEFSFARVFLTSELDSLGDTSHIFHRRTTEGYEMLRVELNHPDELIAAEGPSFLIQPKSDLTIAGNLDTTRIVYNDTAAEYYFFSEMSFYWKDSSNLKYKIIANHGTKVNRDISIKGMVIFPSGDSTIVNGKHIQHKRDVLLPIGFSNVEIIESPRPLESTLDLSNANYGEQSMYVNDTIDALILVSDFGQQTDYVFNDGITKQSRYISTQGRYFNELFDYHNCEIYSAHELNGNKQSPGYFSINSSLYEVKDFGSSSSIDLNGGHSNIERIRKEGNYLPKYVLTGMFYYGSVASGNIPSVIIYPNPSTGAVKIKSEQSIIGKYSLRDLAGKLVQQGQLENNGFKASEALLNGTYFLEVKTLKGSYSSKLILLR